MLPQSLVAQKAWESNVRYSGKGSYGTYDRNDHTDPPHAFVQGPDAVTKKPLDNKRNNCVYCRTIYGREPRVFEAVHVAEPGDKPIVYITSGEGCLHRLNKKDGVSLKDGCK